MEIFDIYNVQLPTLDQFVIFFPISFCLVGLIFLIAGLLKRKFNLKTNYTRKIIHFSLFTMGWLIGAIAGFPALVIYGASIAPFGLLIVFSGDGNFLYESVARPEDAPHRTIYLIVPYIASVLGAFLSKLFVGDFFYIGILVTGIGDAIAEPIGVKFGKHKYSVPAITKLKAKRSIEGSLSVFMIGFLVSLIFFVIRGIGILPLWIFVSIIVGLVSSFVEAISPHGLDNFTIQISASCLSAYLLYATLIFF